MWLEPYIDMYAELKKAKNYFKKDFLKLKNNAVFAKNKNGKCEKTYEACNNQS